MWGAYYPAPRRKSSTSRAKYDPPISPTSPTSPTSHPTYASAIAESPESSANPYFSPNAHQYAHPQVHHTPGLSRVEEDPGYTGLTARSAITGSGGSLAPLLSRDFASRPMVDRIDEAEGSHGNVTGGGKDRHVRPEHVEDGDSYVIPSDLSSAAPTIRAPPPPPAKAQTEPKEPLLIPPPSVHDAYVSSFLDPIAPPDATPTQPPSPAAVDRPPIFRTASAPVQPGQQANTPRRQLLPSPIPIPKPESGKAEEGTPIFEIFDADLSTPAMDMVHALKGHLEQVLSVQEEIGKMHLGLEGLTVSGPEAWEDMDGSNKTPGNGTGSGTNTSRNTPGSLLGRGFTPSTDETGSASGNSSHTRRKSAAGTGSKSPGKESPGAAAALSSKQEEAEHALAMRERGVDEIMEKPSSASPLAPTRTVTTPARNSGRDVSASHNVTTTPDKAKGISPPHIAVANLRGQPMPPSPLQQFRDRSNSAGGPSTFSRSMTTLEETDRPERLDSHGQTQQTHPNHPYRSGRLGPFANSSVSVVQDKGMGYSFSSASLERDRSAEDAKTRATTRDSNLSPLTLSDEHLIAGSSASAGAGAGAGQGSAQTGPSRKWSAWNFGSSTGAKEKEQERGEENWVEHARMKSPELNRDRDRDREAARAPPARRWVESPVEMVDRSRPW